MTLAPACPMKIVCGNFVGLEMLMPLVDIAFILSCQHINSLKQCFAVHDTISDILANWKHLFCFGFFFYDQFDSLLSSVVAFWLISAAV